VREEPGVRGRLVLDDSVVVGTVRIEGDRIAAVELEPEADPAAVAHLPYVTPGFVDVHVHGWGGHDAMGPPEELDGMARALLRHGVTSFLPTAWTSPLDELRAFAGRVRDWMRRPPPDGAAPLGFNLEGPFLAPARKGAHRADWLRLPAETPWPEIEALVDGLRLTTIAPELPGALELIGRLAGLGVRVSVGHSAASYRAALAGYDAGASSTTHLFNAMSGIDHHAPGVAVAALDRDDAWVELIADGYHVDPALWPIVQRAKPADRLLLVSDALPLAGTAGERMTTGGQEVEIRDGKCTIVGTDTIAGSVICLDESVRNLVAHGSSLPAAVAAASRNPLAMLGLDDRGRLAAGQRADLVVLDEALDVRHVIRAGVGIA
jgi:N-acetylglucosamine-6-phosphate deacetylase